MQGGEIARDHHDSYARCGMTVFPGRRRTSVLSLGLAVVLTVSLAVTGSGFWIALAAAVLGVSAVVLFLPRLRADYRGRTRTWDYGDNFPQFAGLAIGAPIAVLLDPAHPTTVYTAHDVESNVNAGRFNAPVIFGVALAAIGAVMIAFVFRLRRRFAEPR